MNYSLSQWSLDGLFFPANQKAHTIFIHTRRGCKLNITQLYLTQLYLNEDCSQSPFGSLYTFIPLLGQGVVTNSLTRLCKNCEVLKRSKKSKNHSYSFRTLLELSLESLKQNFQLKQHCSTSQHISYSPDLASHDPWPFSNTKCILKIRRFATNEDTENNLPTSPKEIIQKQ